MSIGSAKILVALLALLLATACSPLTPVNLLVPDDTYTLMADQPYGENERQKLDVITVVADYRVYPEVTYPAFVEDSAAATAWVRRQQDSWQTKRQPMFVMGHSAGAYNAAMLALDERWLSEHGMNAQEIAGWIGLSGPYEFLPIINPDVKPIFHHPDTPETSQPFYHAGPQSPPALLMAATPDKLVDPQRNTGQLTEKLRSAGVDVETHYYESLHHVTIIVVMADPLQWWEPVVDQVHDFVMRHSRASSEPDS